MGGWVLWPDTEDGGWDEDGGGKNERSPQGVVGTDCSLDGTEQFSSIDIAPFMLPRTKILKKLPRSLSWLYIC